MMSLQKLMSSARRAIEDFNMIQSGDKIAVGLSGGKDSVTLLCILAAMRRYFPQKYELLAITIDMGLDYDINEIAALKKLCNDLNVEYIIEKTQIGEIVFDVRKEQNPCSLCAKMRRGALNETAKKNGCNKVALGHHSNDLVETLFLSMFYEGRLSTFSPVSYLDKTEITVIRPMIYIEEKDISSYSKSNPILNNPCPANKHTQREYVKNLISEIKKDIPFAKDRILSAIINPKRYCLFDKAYKDAELIAELNKKRNDEKFKKD